MSTSVPWRLKPPVILSYAVAVLLVAAAVVVSLGLDRAWGISPSLSLFLCAIMFVAWANGTGPALFATALTLLAFDYFFVEPAYTFALALKDVSRLAIFAIAALPVVFFIAAQARAATALQELNDALRVENAERTRAEEKAQQAEEQLRSIIDTIPVLVTRRGPDGTIDFVNQTWRAFTGFSAAEPRGVETTVIHPEDYARIDQGWAEHLAKGETFVSEYRVRSAGGEYRWLYGRRTPLRDRDENVIAWYGVGHDIEDRKRAEAALQATVAELQALNEALRVENAERKRAEQQALEAEQRFRDLIDTLPALIARREADGPINFLNQTWFDYTGLSRDRPEDYEVATFHPEDELKEQQAWAGHVARGEPYDTEYRLRRFDGEYRWHYVRRAPVRDANGKVVAWYGVAFDTEDRKRAEDALRQSQAELIQAKLELQQLIDTIPIFVATYEPDGRRSFVNKSWQDYMGITLEEATGKAATTFPHFHSDDVQEQAWRAALASGETFRLEARVRRADGEYRWHLSHRVPLRDEKGAVIRWYSVGVDVEDQKRAEVAWRQSEARLIEAQRELQRTIDTIPVLVATYRPDGVRTLVNKQWLIYSGLDFENAVGEAPMLLVHPDDFAEAERGWRASLATGMPLQVEVRVRRGDGEYRWHSIRRVPLRDEKGDVIRWYGVGHDIDDQRRAESALRLSENRLALAERELRLTLDSIPALVWRTQANGFAEYLNQRWLDYAGLSLEQALGWGWRSTMHPDDSERVRDAWRAMRAAGKAAEVEGRMRRFDGEYRWFLFRSSPVHDEAGAIIGWYGTNTDIEDRKRAESALQRSEAYLAEAQRLSRTGSFAWVYDTREYFWSDQTYEIMGIERGVKPTLELVLERVHPEDRAILVREMNRADAGVESQDYEVRVVLQDGEVRHLHVITKHMKYDSGREEKIGALMDVTQARKAQTALDAAQTALAHASRVATLGEISATIAHEVNQPLAAIVANGQACLRVLRREKPDLDDVRDAVEWIVKDGNRAGDVIQRVRGLLKKADTRKVSLDINDVINEVITLLQRELGVHRVSLQQDLAPAMVPVVADRIQIQQVIINLIMNGVEAMQATDRPRTLVIRSHADDAGQVVVAVTDSGTGLAAETKARVFDAFFSTKPSGLGMGLSICRSIIEEHGGQLWSADNGTAPGATFQFALPSGLAGTA